VGATLDLAKTPSEDVDRRVQWRLGDIRFIAKHGLTGEPRNKEAQEQAMQRQFTIELRVDYADPAKNEPMKQALLKSARQIQATATLLSDGQKPDIAIFSEDFFVGKEVLDLMQYVKTTDGDEEAVSSELLAAMKENTDDKPDAY
jgi:hypothetical protein